MFVWCVGGHIQLIFLHSSLPLMMNDKTEDICIMKADVNVTEVNANVAALNDNTETQ